MSLITNIRKGEGHEAKRPCKIPKHQLNASITATANIKLNVHSDNSARNASMQLTAFSPLYSKRKSNR